MAAPLLPARPPRGVETARRFGHCTGMRPRVAFATIVGLLGLALYVGAVVTLGDYMLNRHWALQALYYLVTGIAWAFPMASLMRWAAR